MDQTSNYLTPKGEKYICIDIYIYIYIYIKKKKKKKRRVHYSCFTKEERENHKARTSHFVELL